MSYSVAERFKSIQGEGLYTGTPMAFVRFTGCSVGKRTCHACDTDFERQLPWRGGGTYSAHDLLKWADPYEHLCLTGGEPLDHDLEPLFEASRGHGKTFHIETSGTQPLPDMNKALSIVEHWITCSPKPGYREEVVRAAHEVKIIVPGLGSGPGWPTLEDALEWHRAGSIVFLQPRNGKFDIDPVNLKYVQDLLLEYPQFRLSVQSHKVWKVQ